MHPMLTIVIPSHADNEECLATVQSIYATAAKALFDSELEILIVDDASPKPVCQTIPQMERYTKVNIIRNMRRIGCGPSRYVGACVARGMWLLFVDSHMRFSEGWYEAWKSYEHDPETLYCGSCIGLDDKNMDVTNPKSVYYGATINVFGPDRNRKKLTQVLESIWAPPCEDYSELPSVMGAQYFCHRERFSLLNPLRHLRAWGEDEIQLALKYWLSGGSVRFLKNVRIGHKFKSGGLNKIQPWQPVYNKLFVMNTCLPTRLCSILESKMQKGGIFSDAKRKMNDDFHLVASEEAYNSQIFIRDFYWLAEKFQLQMPT